MLFQIMSESFPNVALFILHFITANLSCAMATCKQVHKYLDTDAIFVIYFTNHDWF